MSSISPLPSRRSTSVLMRRECLPFAAVRWVSGASSSRRMFILTAADRGQVVARAVEEQRLEHGLGRVDGRGSPGRINAIDVEQRVFTRHVLSACSVLRI